jgi:hypothetical protein
MAQPDRTAFIQTMGRQQARQLHIVPTKKTFRDFASNVYDIFSRLTAIENKHRSEASKYGDIS